MTLTSEDSLRLNVLLANPVEAIRIDENNLAVYGLSGEREVKVPLNPDCRAEQYLKKVREMLSGHVLGSPGGYPVFLKRWTRMGQARDEGLADLLLLGEPEAVVAVVYAAGLTRELARRAWWAMPTAENARRMLECEDVVQSNLGRILAEYLIDYLPFETEPLDIIDTVRLVLRPGLIDHRQRTGLWSRAGRKHICYIGFLAAAPGSLPEPLPARADFERHQAVLSGLAASQNPLAALLLQMLDGPGQTFLNAAGAALRRPGHQEEEVVLRDTLGRHFEAASHGAVPGDDVQRAVRCAESLCRTGDGACVELATLLDAVPGLHKEIAALLVLARSGEPAVSGIFAKTTAIGSLMRRKLEPVTAPLREQFAVLRGVPAPEGSHAPTPVKL